MSNTNNEKKSYNRSNVVKFNERFLSSLDPKKGLTVAQIEGFVKNMTISEYEDSRDHSMKKVARLNISCFMDPNRIKYIFGEEAANPNYPESVFVDLSVFGREAEYLEQNPPCLDQKISAMIVNPEVRTANGRDGKVFRTVQAKTSDRIYRMSSSKDANGNTRPTALNARSSGNNGSNSSSGNQDSGYQQSAPAPAQAPAQAAAPAGNTGIYSGGGFYTQFDDDSELPF